MNDLETWCVLSIASYVLALAVEPYVLGSTETARPYTLRIQWVPIVRWWALDAWSTRDRFRGGISPSAQWIQLGPILLTFYGRA